MRVKLRGLASATKRLADGRRVTYWYAWRGGPRLEGMPGSPEFMSRYNAAVATRTAPQSDTFARLITAYRESPTYQALAASTRANYAVYLDMIAGEFGRVPVAALNDSRMRGEFMEWRDGFAATPRKADYLWTTLARVLAFSKDRGKLMRNVCERGGRIYTVDRSDRIWNARELDMLNAAAAPPIRAAVMLALWTGQRQGDLLRLEWSSYDGQCIRLRQSKAARGNKLGRVITIPVAGRLKIVLEELNRLNGAQATPSKTILTNTYGKPWTTDGFKTSWGKTIERAGLKDAGLTFHDIRGTAITRLAIAECTVPQIAAISGHSLTAVTSILDRYLSRDSRLAKAAISALEKTELAFEIANQLQTEALLNPIE